MDIKDLRIGDRVTTKTLTNTSEMPPMVVGLDHCGEVSINVDNYNIYVFSDSDIKGVKVNDDVLIAFGAWYDNKKLEYIFTFKGGLRIAVRKNAGYDYYTATPIGQYRPKYCNFTYLHTLQHWLWDMYKIAI